MYVRACGHHLAILSLLIYKHCPLTPLAILRWGPFGCRLHFAASMVVHLRCSTVSIHSLLREAASPLEQITVQQLALAPTPRVKVMQ